MKHLIHLFIFIFMLPSTAIYAGNEKGQKPFERRDSDHIKEILEAWDEKEGAWLYESMAALVMDEQHPERPIEVNNTTFELLQKMDENRKERIDRAASSELENERNSSGNREGNYYWEEWLTLFRSSDCDMNQSSSNGDPHMRTYDGEKYDFQTAGDYLLTTSDNENFLIQVQQVRHNERISVNGAAFLNVNGDEIELFAQNHPDEHINKVMRINGEIVKDERSEIILEHGGIIRFENGRNVVNWPTGEQLHFKTRSFQDSKLLDLFIFVPKCRSTYNGLLGDNNGDRSDDVALRDENGEVTTKREQAKRDTENIFGPGRKNDAQRLKQQAELNFVARSFGDQYVLDNETSRFTNPMVDLEDSVRYPLEHLTLAELTDEEVEEALAKCREAGVAEENLYECAFDYGYVGLEPLTTPEYLAQNVIKENSVPAKQKEENARDNNNNNSPQIRIGTGVFRPVIVPQTPRPQTRQNGNRQHRTPRTGTTPRGGR